MNWHEKGKVDGMQGKSWNAFSNYYKACSEHGVVADQEQYTKGRNEGLRLFCTYENGRQKGRQGLSYSGVCPKKWESRFLKGHSKGLESFCSYENGQKHGRSGQTYNGACPQEWESRFLKGYYIGQKEFEIQQKERELKRKERELDRKEDQMRWRETAISRHEGQSCHMDRDCKIRDNCYFGTCQNSGLSCSYNSDCEISGRCTPKIICKHGDRNCHSSRHRRQCRYR